MRQSLAFQVSRTVYWNLQLPGYEMRNYLLHYTETKLICGRIFHLQIPIGNKWAWTCLNWNLACSLYDAVLHLIWLSFRGLFSDHSSSQCVCIHYSCWAVGLIHFGSPPRANWCTWERCNTHTSRLSSIIQTHVRSYIPISSKHLSCCLCHLIYQECQLYDGEQSNEGGAQLYAGADPSLTSCIRGPRRIKHLWVGFALEKGGSGGARWGPDRIAVCDWKWGREWRGTRRKPQAKFRKDEVPPFACRTAF